MKIKKPKKSRSGYEKFSSISQAEKEAVYQECDDPDVAMRSRPLDSRMKKLWKRAKSKGGRPRIGRGATRVLISIERGLLEDVDDFARRRRVTRSQLFSEGVKTVLSKAG
jgi:hypothetical protein